MNDQPQIESNCWANCLGDCGGGISREHYVSECIFPNQEIFVQGLNFCLDRPVLLHSRSVTAKILCVDHNRRLGEEVDWIAGKAFESIREFTALRDRRREFPQLSWLPRVFKIDSRGLERWCLKTMINFSIGQKKLFGIGPGNQTDDVDDELVEIAFGLKDFTVGRGLYVAFQNYETFNLEDRLHYTAKVRGNNLLVGHFALHSIRFYLNLEPSAHPITLIGDSNVFYRKAEFVDPVEPIPEETVIDSVQALIRVERAKRRFLQKLSIA